MMQKLREGGVRPATEIGWCRAGGHARAQYHVAIVTAAITNEAVDELQLKVGDAAYAVVKASDVMVGKD